MFINSIFLQSIRSLIDLILKINIKNIFCFFIQKLTKNIGNFF